MSWQTVVLVGINTFQLVALAWIAAWQARAGHELRKLNGAYDREQRRARTARRRRS